MAKAINIRNSKRAFGMVYVEAIGGQHIKNLFKVKEVLGRIFAENENVIAVNEHEGKGAEKGVNEELEGVSCIF